MNTPESTAALARLEAFRDTFEKLGRANGFMHWSARAMAEVFGYGDYDSFRKGAINRAIAVCTTLNIPIEENFAALVIEVDGKHIHDMKLSRFACYLVAMNGDTKKPAVALAQLYFATIAEYFRQHFEGADNIERVYLRDEVTGREKSLSRTASSVGVKDYALFQNAGYRGMYNMSLGQLKKAKAAPDLKRCLLDYMGKTELAANLFRITQTEEKLRRTATSGQISAERIAESVGKAVRKTMIELNGTPPEKLPLSGDIKSVKANLKAAARSMKKLDGKPGKGKRVS